MHGVCGRYSTLQPLPLCSVRHCPDSVFDKLTRQGMMQTSARPVYPRSWARLSPPASAQPVYPLSLLLEAAQYLLKRSILPSSRLRCRKGRACCRTPLLRVNRADAAAVAAMPPAWQCLLRLCMSAVVPDKQRLCTHIVAPISAFLGPRGLVT